MRGRASAPSSRAGARPDRQARGLRQASAKKAKRARQAAEAGLAAVIGSGEVVNFAAVARASGVSANYLRKQPDLAAQIFLLRSREQSKMARATSDEHGGQNSILLLPGGHDAARCSQELTKLLARNRELEMLLEEARAEIARLMNSES